MKNIEKLNAKFIDLQQIVSPLLDKKKIPSLVGKYNEKLEDYESLRYLDAWARVLNIKTPCSAVAQIDETIYLSFNKVEQGTNQNTLNIIKKHLDNDNRDFLFPTLLCNTALAEQTLYSTPLAKKMKLNLETVRGKLFAGAKKNISGQNIITEQDKTTLLKLQEELFASYNSKDQKLIKVLLRINQDVSKIIFYKKNTNIDFQLIDNPKELHAELAVLSWIKEHKLGKLHYIGISKLSCYLCTETLDELDISYRGSHGKLYLNKWVFPDKLFSKKDADEKFQTLITKIDAHRTKHWQEADTLITINKKLSEKLPSEEAELSDSDNDKNIRLIAPINGSIFLHEVKETMLIKQVHLTSIKAYDLVQFSRESTAHSAYYYDNNYWRIEASGEPSLDYE